MIFLIIYSCVESERRQYNLRRIRGAKVVKKNEKYKRKAEKCCVIQKIVVILQHETILYRNIWLSDECGR